MLEPTLYKSSSMTINLSWYKLVLITFKLWLDWNKFISLLVIGDGRSEVSAGVQLGAYVISRLNLTDTRQREIHKQLKTNIIVDYYDMEALSAFMSKED